MAGTIRTDTSTIGGTSLKGIRRRIVRCGDNYHKHRKELLNLLPQTISMNRNPIIIIDDDDDDLALIQEGFKELGIENELIIFNDGYKFLEFVKSTNNKTFFILCDINISKISGLELKRITYEDEELRLKCVPFVLLSTGMASHAVMEAYSFGVQGYFIKPNTFEEIKEMLGHIVNYWKYSQHPNV